VQSKSSDLNTSLLSVPSLDHKREMMLAPCQVHHKKFSSKGNLVGAAAMSLFHKIAQMKNGILLLLLLIMATCTLITCVDDMDEVYIPGFNVFLLNQNEIAATTKNGVYIKKLSDDSLLSILKPRKAKKAFEDEESREKNLFHVFLNHSLFEAMLQWMNVDLRKRGSREILIEKLYAYVGLEIAMSIVQIGSIIEYWETNAAFQWSQGLS
jgi:hypothetical protein